MLHIYPVKVTVHIAVAEAHKPHGLLAVEQLIARLKVDDRAAVIIQALRDIVPYPAHRVDRLYKGGQVEHSVAVNIKARQLAHMAAQRLDAVVAVVARAPIDAVDLPHGRVDIDEGVARDAHGVESMAHGVELCDHDCICIAGAVVIADEEDGIHSVLTARAEGRAALHPAARGRRTLRRTRLRRARRLTGRVQRAAELLRFSRRRRGLLPKHIYAHRGDRKYRRRAERSQNYPDSSAFFIHVLAFPTCLCGLRRRDEPYGALLS